MGEEAVIITVAVEGIVEMTTIVVVVVDIVDTIVVADGVIIIGDMMIEDVVVVVVDMMITDVVVVVTMAIDVKIMDIEGMMTMVLEIIMTVEDRIKGGLVLLMVGIDFGVLFHCALVLCLFIFSVSFYNFFSLKY